MSRCASSRLAGGNGLYRVMVVKGLSRYRGRPSNLRS